MDRRHELINYAIKKFKYTSYLEIGVNYSEACFDIIECQDKVGVDPNRGGQFRMTSDDFFDQNSMTFDVIFIDGLHHAEQVYKDIENSLRVLNKNGTIFMHDCSPFAEFRQFKDGANGDVWKAAVHYRQREDLDMIVVDIDQGCGVIRCRSNQSILKIDKDYLDLEWKDLAANRVKYLNLVTPEDFSLWL